MNINQTTELKCFDCGHEWTWHEDSIPRCPECGSDDVLDPVTSDLEPEPEPLTQD